LSQEVITRILNAERQAVQIRDKAQHEATRLIEEAERAAAVSQKDALDQARQEAEQIVAEGQAAAEQSRSGVIAQAQKEADRSEAAMLQQLDRAVRYVLEQVTGQA
jgi:vacuolar-type H+-ATPase subunit H